MCPDGTCNGCLYHILLESASACPVCTERDFERISGECVNGKQIVHLVPMKHCVIVGKDEKKQIEQPCTMITLAVQIVIAVSSALALLLIATMYSVWKKSKR